MLKASTNRQPVGFQDEFRPETLTQIIKMESKLGKLPLGSTEEGRRFAFLALHPCSEVAPRPVQYPDGLNIYSVPSRNQVVNPTAPFVWNNNGTPVPLPTGDWDLQFLFLPTPELPCVYRWKASELNVWSPWTPMHIDQATRYGLTNTGWVVPEEPNKGHLTVPPAIETVPSRMNDCETLRRVYRGFTTVLNCNDLTNQGMVTGVQWASVSDEVETLPLENATELISNQGDVVPDEIKFLVYRDVPVTTADMFAKSNEVEHYRANEGMYMVMHGVDSPNLYRETTGSTMTMNGSVNTEAVSGKPVCLIAAGEAAAITMDKCIATPPMADGTRKLYTVTDKLNYKVGMIMYTGIDKSATVDIKMVDCWQAVPLSTSSSHYNRDAPCDPDPMAVDSVKMITNRMKHAYPAVYNDGGLLATVVGALAHSLLPKAIPWITGLWNKYIAKGNGKQRTYIEEEVD